ncbi:hypothetical protein EWM62_15805 [Mucilaginibacter terrigena]|uniref:DUF4251 domain-containing protein n=1 Tax=Mucilaginibacter terrigena TaxID=2492395 RepID=A0A4Q5LIN6_9SPHI|nr:hypothetical protein [Mucilaginibacter terrigena]RYU87956.1 hypothetical protein EWM62_15805 [Mucilaginibacter terrigena]
MKKARYLLLFALMFSAAVNAQTAWVAQKLDEQFLVKFPAAPLKEVRNDVDVYTLRQADSVAYSANMVDYFVMAHLDSAALAPIKDDQRFADGLRTGIASKKINYTFGPATIGKWETYTTYNLTGVDNTTKSTLYLQMILVGSRVYSLSCRVPVNVDTKDKDLFFGSAELLKK